MKRILALFVTLFFTVCLWIPSQSRAQEDWSQKGLSHLKLKEHKEAIEAFSKAIAEAYNNRGVAWHHKGDYEKAIADYNRALELYPDYAEARNNRGVAWAYKGDYDRAVTDCTQAIKINPSYANAYNNRAYAWQQKGDLDKAIKDYSRAVEIDDQYVQAYHARGFAWDSKGDYDKAIADYDKALEIRARDADVYGKRGTAWAHKGDYDKAIADYNEALEIDPKFDEAYYNRAVMWTRKGAFDKAIADYTQALDVNPKYSEAYNQLARILAVCPDRAYRNGEKAVEYAKKALELNMRAEYLDTLAAAHAEQGQFEDAVKVQEKAVDLLKEEGGTEKQLTAYRERLEAYKANKTWRQTPATEGEDRMGNLNPAQSQGAQKPHFQKESPAGLQVLTPKVFSVQVGAFKSLKNAEKMTARLKKKGYAARTVAMTYSGGSVLHTVLSGTYDTLDEAKTAAAALERKENMSASIRAINTP